MAAFVDEAGIFGLNETNLMPTVFIDRILLNGGSDPVVVDNPHIDHEWEGVYVRDQYGNLKYTHPGHNLSRKSKSSTALVSTVNLVVKDIVSNETVSTWFYDNQILKYMNIRVVQSRDKNLTAQLNAGNISALSDSRYRNRYEQAIIALGTTDKELQNYYTQDDTGRNRVSSIPYTATFTSKSLEPDHLAYFAFCYLDIKKLSQDFNLELYGYDYNNGIVSKQVTQELVIDSGQLVEESHIYYTEGGAIWAGPVHYHAPTRQWMAGARHTSEPHPALTRQTVQLNATVQDFRNIQDVELSEINLKPLESIVDRLREKYDANSVSESKAIPYFSEAYMSRSGGAQESSQFVFTFNYLDFLKNESQFGLLYENNSDTRNEIFSYSKIKSLKVFRRRVTTNGLFNTVGVETSGDNFKANPYDTSVEVPYLVAQTSDSGFYSATPRVKRDKNGNKIGSVREIRLKKHDSDLRSFAVSDFSADSLTDGTYKYSVEITVEDGALSFMRDQIKKIRSAIDEMSVYGEIASSHGYYDSKSGRFREALLKYYTSKTVTYDKFPWILPLAVFVNVVGLLSETNTIDTALYKRLFSMINPRTGSPEGIAAVVSLMEQVAAVVESAVGDSNKIQKRSQKAGSLSTAKKQSFLKAEKMFPNLLNSEVPRSYGLDFLGLQSRNDYAGPKSITVSDYGDRLIRENIKYFSPSPTLFSDPIASPMIDVGEASAAPSEIVDGIQDFSTYSPAYLTPVTIRNGISVLDNTTELTSESDQTYNQINGFFVKFFNSRFDERGNKFEVSTKEQTKDTEKIDFLAKLGVSVTEYSIYRQKLDSSTDSVSSRDVMSEDDDFVSEEITYSSEQGVPLTAGINEIITNFTADSSLMNSSRYSTSNDKSSLVSQTDIPLVIGDFRYENWESTLDAYISGFYEAGPIWDTESIRKIPNQIKSVFWSDQAQIRLTYKNIDYDYINNPKTANAFISNHQVIARVETLSATRTPDGALEYNWSALTEAQLSSLATGTGDLVLLRVVPYTESRLKVGTSLIADVPYYDNHFIIAPSEEIASQNAVAPLSPRRDTTLSTLLALGSSITRQMVNFISPEYLRTSEQPKMPVNRGHFGYYDVFRQSKGNTVITLIEETGCEPPPPEEPDYDTDIDVETAPEGEPEATWYDATLDAGSDPEFVPSPGSDEQPEVADASDVDVAGRFNPDATATVAGDATSFVGDEYRVEGETDSSGPMSV